MIHTFISPFVARAKASPVGDDGWIRLRMLAHDLARVRNALSRKEAEGLAVLTQSDRGDSCFEATLADGSRVRVDRVSPVVQELVRELDVFRADELTVSKAPPAMVGTPEGIARHRRDGDIDADRFMVRAGSVERMIGREVFNELVAAGVKVDPVGT